MTGTMWADTSHYQTDQFGAPVYIDESYPFDVYSFRTNSGDQKDRMSEKTCKIVLDLLNSGKLKAVIAYYFFRPGEGNCDLHREILLSGGLWGHPKLVTMVDVEDAVGTIRGDQSYEVNDEVARLVGWYNLDKRRVIGYLNTISNSDLWLYPPDGMRFVTPSYSGVPGKWTKPEPLDWMKKAAFAQQFTSSGMCKPWPQQVDLNHSSLELEDFLQSLGIEDEMDDPVEVGAAQLHPFPSKIRPILDAQYVNESTRTPDAPWPYDMFADIWNNVVWDGYTLPLAPGAAAKSFVGWILDIAARQVDIQNSQRKILDNQRAIMTHLGINNTD